MTQVSRPRFVKRSQNYTTLSLLDLQGEDRLSFPDGEQGVHHYRKQLARQAIDLGKIIMSDLHLGSSGKPEIDLLAPLLATDRDTVHTVGAMYFQIDPAQFLFPLIQTWTVDSQTAETLLVRRQGDQVLYLNELRHRSNTALRFQLPLDNPNLPAAQAA